MLAIRCCSAVMLFLASALAGAQAPTGGIPWSSNLDEARSTAKSTGKPVLVHFWTPTCGPCKLLDANVFAMPQVGQAVGQMVVPVKVNAAESMSLAEQYGVTRVPTDVLISPDGKVIDRFVSPATPMDYVSKVTQAVGAYRTQAGSAYETAANQAPYAGVVNDAYSKLAIPTQNAATAAAATAATADRYASQAQNAAANPYAAWQGAAGGASAAAPAPQVTQNASAAGPAPAPQQGGPQQSVAQQPSPAVVVNAAASPVAQTPVAQIPAAQMPGAKSPAAQMQTAQTPVAQAPAVEAAAAQPSQVAAVQLPPGSPPLGFDGFCPVTMKRDWKWIPGNVQFGAIHRGRTYLFASGADRDEFLRQPDTYSPAMSGMDPVLAIDNGQAVPGVRKHALEYAGSFYWFSSEDTLNQFWNNAPRYSEGVRQAMATSGDRVKR